jgi:hypothetical protein
MKTVCRKGPVSLVGYSHALPQNDISKIPMECPFTALTIIYNWMAYHMQSLGFGTKGSLRNFLRIFVHVSATSSWDNISMYSASRPEIQPRRSVSDILENE